MVYTRGQGKDAFCPFPLGSKSARIRGNTPHVPTFWDAGLWVSGLGSQGPWIKTVPRGFSGGA